MREGGKEEGGRGIEGGREMREEEEEVEEVEEGGDLYLHRTAQYLITGAVLHFLCLCTGADLIDQILYFILQEFNDGSRATADIAPKSVCLEDMTILDTVVPGTRSVPILYRATVTVTSPSMRKG